MSTPRMWDGLDDTRAIITPLDNSEGRAHLLDYITIGQCIADVVAWVYPESPTLAATMPSICIIRVPVGVTVDVAEVVFLGEMIDKNLLDSGVGVRMLGKQ